MMKISLIRLKSFVAEDVGATAIEYALIASLLSIVIIGGVSAVNGSLTGIYETIQSYIQPALDGSPMPNEE